MEQGCYNSTYSVVMGDVNSTEEDDIKTHKGKGPLDKDKLWCTTHQVPEKRTCLEI